LPLSNRRDRAFACADLSRGLVAVVFGVSHSELEMNSRSSPVSALARQIAMYLTHVVFAVSLSRTGLAFGRDRTTAAHACRVVEEAREDGEFDFMMERLSSALRVLCAGPHDEPEVATW
jgi:chromosomal replication initiation ATPase DnaA